MPRSRPWNDTVYPALRSRSPTAALLVAALGAATLLPRPAGGQQASLTRYTTARGLPSARVTAVLQDARGYLWFGTPAGLARYDGSSFRVFTTADGLASSFVTGLARDASGRIFVATGGGGVDVVDGDRVLPLSGEFSGRDRVRSLMTGADGTIWIASERGAATSAQGGVVSLVPADSLPDGCCSVVLRDRRNRVWLGTSQGLFGVGNAGAVAVAGTRTAIRAILDTAEGLWVGSDEGLFLEQAGRLVRVPVAVAGAVTALAADAAGALWVGTEHGEVLRRGGPPLRIDQDAGLPEGGVNALMVDREGSVWIGTDGGLAKWVETSFAAYGRQQGLQRDFVVDVRPAAAGGVWVATRGGLARLDARGLFAEAVVPPVLPVTGAAVVDADLLIATRKQLWRWSDRNARLAAEFPDEITAIAAGEPTWVGTRGGLYSLDRDNPVLEQRLGGSVSITALERDARGSVWIGTHDRGLFVATAERLDPVASAGRSTIWDIAADPDGGIWVATNGGGVMRIDATGNVVGLTRAGNGLTSDFVQQVVPIGNGRVWLYTNRGLDLWDPTAGVTHYDLRDGLPSLAGNPGAGTVDAAGNPWFGTPSGVAVYRSSPATVRPVPPRMQIDQVALDGVALAPEALLQLGPDIGVLSFSYTALSFRDESGIRFQYRLRGRNDDWSRLTSERHVSYVGLPAGEYVFEVQAIDDRGQWSEAAATASLVIRPAVWEMPAIRIAALAALLLAMLLLFRRRLRTVEDERLRLRRMVDKRTLELVEKNALLERMATTDELTGLPNRRFFLESMQRELRKMARSGVDDELSLLVIDLDRFKSINDRFGHAAGDEVLRQVARRLARGVRATDLPARYGGEEFAILLPSTVIEGGRFLAEKLRTDLEALDMRFEGTRMPVTISVGVASLHTPQRYDPAIEESLLKRADEAMYQAKTGGRNRVVVAD